MTLKNNLAPIILFVYNRADNAERTVECLQKNRLAKDSDLFIFSDGYKGEKDKKDVLEVRKYIKTIDGFKNITITESPKNKGLGASIISGVNQVIRKYKKVIVVEDDLQTTPDFLEYLNQGLEFYKDDKKIYSLGAYMPPIALKGYAKNDVVFIPRICSWGWAIWEDRWMNNDWDISDYNTFIKDAEQKKHFSRAGKDMLDMLINQVEGSPTAWAIRCDYNRFKQGDSLTVYPCSSKVLNIGTDGRGVNTPKTDKFNISLENDITSTNFRVFQIEDSEVTQEFYKFMKRDYKSVAIIYLRRLGLLELAKKVFKK